MAEDNAGTEHGNIAGGSGGVDPTRPIGPGNPPAAHQWRAGHSGNPAGMKKGTRHMRLVAKDMLDAIGQELTLEKREAAAKFLGKEGPDALTNRELMLLSQLERALKGSTPAFLAIAKIAGEFVEKIEGLEMAGRVILLNPSTRKVNLDDFSDNPEAMEALLAEMEAEAKERAEKQQ